MFEILAAYWFPILLGVGAFFLAGLFAFLTSFYQKAGPDKAIVRAGGGKMVAVTGGGIFVIPVVHQKDGMDLSVKRIEIARQGEGGLICRDNIRADIEVAFFVRVNNQVEDILQVARMLGCDRASDPKEISELFNAKFSEALKTVGKQFEFVELFTERDKFKHEILNVIGTDLNGYVLDDCAIDYLEQTPVDKLDPRNVLDAEGIKKITDLTAQEHIISNEINREKEKTIKKQDVEAKEAILELEKQQVEAEEKQKREIAEIAAREAAQAEKVRAEELLKSETARITTEEEVKVAEENKDRQILVAMRNKERTDAVEQERVEKERHLEATERERAVGVAQVSKEKDIETEKRNIQEVIRERVMVERSVVEEQERIKDTEAFAGADRQKKVTVTAAEEAAQQQLVKEVKAAEAAKNASELIAEKTVIEAEASRAASEKEMQATKMLAEAKAADHAAVGLADAEVMEARAGALEKEGTAEATVIERKITAEAKGQEAKAVAIQKEGTAEAEILRLKLSSEAKGIEEKAEAMKLLDGVGKEHEEFKLQLQKDQDIEVAAIGAQADIAKAQAGIVGEAMKSARIDIVGGDSEFFDKIVNSVQSGKVIDRFVGNSSVVTDVKNTFFTGSGEHFREKVQAIVKDFNLSTDEIKDLSIAALLAKLMGLASKDGVRAELNNLFDMASNIGVLDEKTNALKLGSAGVGSNGKDA